MINAAVCWVVVITGIVVAISTGGVVGEGCSWASVVVCSNVDDREGKIVDSGENCSALVIK